MKTSAIPEVRDLRFALEGVPKQWHRVSRSVTLFYNNLSIFFPAGERFFIAAMKAQGPFVGDAKLKADVAAFCAQEGHHSREHVNYNDLLRRQGYPIDAMEARIEAILRRVARRGPPWRRLAVTVCLEHFTAMLASLVLADPRVLADAEPRMAALWRWHAAEEDEHKHVAFDLYVAAAEGRQGRRWLGRCAAMLITTLIFWGKILEHQARLMHHDGILFSPREWWSLVRYLYWAPGGLQTLVVPYLSFFRPTFHPTDYDRPGLLQAWRAQAAASPPNN